MSIETEKVTFKNGKVYSWGGNTSVTMTRIMGRPILNLIDDGGEIEFPTPSKIVEISTTQSGENWVAICESGEIYEWGQAKISVGPQLTVFKQPIRFRSVVTNSHCSIGLSEDGLLYSWAPAYSIQLGRKFSDTFDLVKVNKKKRFVKITGSETHCLALTDKGQVYAWGQNSTFQCGLPNAYNVKYPRRVNLPERAVGIYVTCVTSGVVTEKGKIYSWGVNYTGQLGIGKISNRKCSPKLAKCLEGFVSVFGGRMTCAAITHDGRLFTWGEGSQGCLGHGDASNVTAPKQLLVEEGSKIITVRCCFSSLFILTDKGNWYFCGSNFLQYGELLPVSSNVPIPVKLPDDGINFVEILSITNITVAITGNPLKHRYKM